MPGQAPNSGDCPWLAPTTQAWPASSCGSTQSRTAKGCDCDTATPAPRPVRSSRDVQPVEVVCRQALAPGEDGDLEPPSSQGPQLRGRRGLHELNLETGVVGEQPRDGAWQQRCRCRGESSDDQPAGEPITQPR